MGVVISRVRAKEKEHRYTLRVYLEGVQAMNTSINFNPVNTIQAGSKIAHVFRNHNLNKKRVSQEIEKNDDDRGAIILHPYIKSIDTKKLGTSKITKNLAVYRKRYEVALSKGDIKTSERNKIKVEQLEKELQGFKKARRGREASLVETSWSITKFPPSDALVYDKDILLKIKDIALKILQDNFPELDIDQVGVAGHIDQASIHIHTVFDIPESTTFSKMIKNKKYGEFQKEFNDAIRKKFGGLPIEKITPHGKKYVPLLQYKRENPLEQPTKKNSTGIHMQLESQKEILEATVKSKEELLKTQVSRNELLEKSNGDLKAQLEELKALNVAKEDEKVKLQEELKISREMLKEAQKAQEQSKENERLEAGKTKNIKRAEYTKPLDKKEIQKALDNAPDGSASSSRLRLVLDGKIDFSKIKADTPEAMQIIDNAKADFEALEEKGLLTCNKGVYTFTDERSKDVIYKMHGASAKDIVDIYYNNVYKRKNSNKNR